MIKVILLTIWCSMIVILSAVNDGKTRKIQTGYNIINMGIWLGFVYWFSI